MHVQKFKVRGHPVQKLEWKQTDRQTYDGNSITDSTNAVGNKYVNV